MRIGSQKVLISIFRRLQMGKTPAGEPVWSWQEWLPDILAEVTTRRGKEQFDPASKKRFGEVVWHFRTRMDEIIGVDETMELAHEGNRFKIRSVLPDAQNRRDVILECILEDGALESRPLLPAITEAINVGVVGEIYEQFSVSASGGEPPYRFAAAGLPPGLSINAASGLISGTPTTAGVYSVTITVSDEADAFEIMPAFDIAVEVP